MVLCKKDELFLWFLVLTAHEKHVQSGFSGHFILTFLDEWFQLRVEAQPVTLPPQAHVGGVMLPVAVVDGIHGVQLPPAPAPAPARRLLLLPAGRAAPGPQRQAVVGDVDEARDLTAAGQASTSVSVPPGVSLVPVVGTHRHGQHAEGAERQRQSGVEQQLPRSHGSLRAASAPR